MPSTFSPNLHLELQATGENAGTWGQVLDNNVFSIIDQVLGNTLSLPLTNTNITLNTAQSQNNFIDLTGTLTGNVQIIFPAIGRTYFVRNGTTGNFSVTLKTAAAGATVVIQQGQSGFFVLNGTDVLAVSNTLYSPTVKDLLTVTSSDAGATAAPTVDLFRDSASPAASDLLAQLLWNGRDSAANKQLYASIVAQILDPTSTTEDAILAFSTVVAGALATRFNLGAGLYSPNATGGDKGVDTINALGFYQDGQAISSATQGTQQNATGSSVTFAGIPAGAKVLYVMANGVSFNSGDSLLLKLGTSGGLVSSGYTGGMGWFRGGGATASQSASVGMTIALTSGHSDICECLATLVLMNASTNTWIMQASGTFNGGNLNASTSSGVVSLPGALTQVQLSALGGSSFAAGTLNIAWSR